MKLGERQAALKSATAAVWASPANLNKPTGIQRLAALTLLLVVILGLNIHLFAFQLYGWSGMLLNYHVTTQSWTTAAQQTLSGDAPCRICRHIESAVLAGDHSFGEESTSYPPSLFYWSFLFVEGRKTDLLSPPSPTEGVAFPVTIPAPRASSPPVPPPKFASV